MELLLDENDQIIQYPHDGLTVGKDVLVSTISYWVRLCEYERGKKCEVESCGNRRCTFKCINEGCEWKLVCTKPRGEWKVYSVSEHSSDCNTSKDELERPKRPYRIYGINGKKKRKEENQFSTLYPTNVSMDECPLPECKKKKEQLQAMNDQLYGYIYKLEEFIEENVERSGGSFNRQQYRSEAGLLDVLFNAKTGGEERWSSLVEAAVNPAYPATNDGTFSLLEK